VTGCYVHCNKVSGSIKHEEFPDLVSDCEVVKKNSTARS